MYKRYAKIFKEKNIETIIHYPNCIHKHLFKDEIFFKKNLK